MEEKKLRPLVRITNTDLEGDEPLYHALTRIKGVSFMYANMVCYLSGLDKYTKIGYLGDPDIKKIEDIIKNPLLHKAPVWMLNRRKDIETGENKHIITGELDFVKDNDIKMMKKIRSYRGIRHSLGLPVRGQRTKSNFRANKGKVHLGVKKGDSKKGRV